VTLSPYHGATVEEIDPLRKVDVQAAAQRWVCHAISNTTNPPEEVTTETVAAIVMRAWETGCKGVTTYRKNSMDAVIVDASAAKVGADGRPIAIEEHFAPKRPETLPCAVHHERVKGERYTVLVGLLGDRPYEVFAGLSETAPVPMSAMAWGFITKHDGGDAARYALAVGDTEVVSDIPGQLDNPTQGAFTRAVSLALRHGVPLPFLVEQLRKDKNSDVTSFSAVIARVLARYIKDGPVVTKQACPSCGSSNLTYQQGCMTCLGCGHSKCG
jgi:ribonucleoside-diphosphate reductase alpha chain